MAVFQISCNGEIVNGTRSPLGIDFAAGNQYLWTIGKARYNAVETSLRYSGRNGRSSLQFRAEMFNAFNHAQFLNPSGNINSSAFMVRPAIRASVNWR